ncbi:hypothetical protein H6G65_09845 [Microcystis elabens FACHB-917]|nr:hypothetical protein [Microcystis elabens FACHB-917]
MGCPRCGSWAVRADRSLAGRMVCARCGEPLGLGRARRVADGTRRRGQGGRSALVLPRRWRLWLLLGGLLAVSAVLASVPERPTRPPERRGIEPMRGVVLWPPTVPTGSGDVAIL